MDSFHKDQSYTNPALKNDFIKCIILWDYMLFEFSMCFFPMNEKVFGARLTFNDDVNGEGGSTDGIAGNTGVKPSFSWFHHCPAPKQPVPVGHCVSVSVLTLDPTHFRIWNKKATNKQPLLVTKFGTITPGERAIFYLISCFTTTLNL